MRFVIWLAEQELKTHAIQEHEVAAAVRVQALYRGRSARQLGSSACESGAGLGGPAALAKRAAAAQQRDTQQFALRNGIDFRELNALLRKSGRPTSSQGRPTSSQGRPTSSQGRPASPQRRPASPQGPAASGRTARVQAGSGSSRMSTPHGVQGNARPCSTRSDAHRVLSAAGVPFEVHPAVATSASTTTSMARARRQYDAQVSAEGELLSQRPTFAVRRPPPPPSPYVPSPAEWQSSPRHKPPPLASPSGSQLQQPHELHSALPPKPVMLSNRPASARGAAPSPRVRGATDARFFYPAPLTGRAQRVALELALAARSPRVTESPLPLPPPAGAFAAVDYSAILSHKGVLSSPRPSMRPNSSTPRRAHRARPHPAAPLPDRTVRWPEQPKPRCTSRPHRGQRTLPTAVGGSTAFGRPFTTYFLINA